MTFRRITVPLFTLMLAIPPLLAAATAQAETKCKEVPGIAPGIAKFIDELAAAQAAGQGTLPLVDVFFGFTDISAEDLNKLDQRVTVTLNRRDAQRGDYVNEGAETQIEGLFADDPTWVRLPKLVRGRYAFDAKGVVTLTYDPEHTVELGERHLGMFFFKKIHHSVIARDGASIFLDDNAGPDPDRCYHVPAG